MRNNLSKVKVIAASTYSYDYFKNKLPNEIIYIPHHHVNRENIKRDRKEVIRCGYIGTPSQEAIKFYGEVGQELKKIGFEFITCFDFKAREDAINLYRNIDILIIAEWKWGDVSHVYKFPTKLINAASFGVPTIAFPRAGYKEFEGNYVRANNMEEMLSEVKKFRDKDYYQEWSEKILKVAENYHISKIANLYRNLS